MEGRSVLAIFSPLSDELTIVILATVAALSIVIGALGYRYPDLPVISTILIVAAFVGYIALVIVWNANRPDCPNVGLCAPESWAFNALLSIGFMASASIVAIVWTSYAASIGVRSLLHWVRDQ